MLDVSEKTAVRLIKKAIGKFMVSTFDEYDTVRGSRVEVLGRDGRMKDYALIEVTSDTIIVAFTNVRRQEYVAYAKYNRPKQTYSSAKMPEFVLPLLKEFVLATNLAGLEKGELQLQT